MRIQYSGSRELQRLVAVLAAVDRELVATYSATPPAARSADALVVEEADAVAVTTDRGTSRVELRAIDDADPLDRVARQAGLLADAVGIPRGDTPLLRALRDDERRLQPGRAPSLAVAEAWLRDLAAGGPLPARVVDSFVERVAPALLPLSAMNALQLTRSPAKLVDEHRRFFQFVEGRCADARYAQMQEAFLNLRALLVCLARTAPSATEYIRSEKYFFAPYWLSSKLVTARNLGLDRGPPRSMLDLGAGPAHFGLVCAYHGHDYHGLDMIYSSTTPFSDQDLYGEMFASFGIPRSVQRIEAHTPLQVDRRFDRITCLMGNFCALQTPAGPVPWPWPAWEDFLRDVFERVVAPGFEIYLHINRQYLPEEIRARFVALGATVDAEKSTVRITEAQARALR